MQFCSARKLYCVVILEMNVSKKKYMCLVSRKKLWHTDNGYHELSSISVCLCECICSFCGSMENCSTVVHSKTFLTSNPDLESSSLESSLFPWNSSITCSHKLFISSLLTQRGGAMPTVPQRWVCRGQIGCDVCICDEWISYCSLIRGNCANPISIQCRPCTVSARKSVRGPLRCPGRVRQWAQYHSVHRQQCAGVRGSHTQTIYLNIDGKYLHH